MWNKESLALEEDLVAEGLTNSLSILKLIDFMEATFGIHVADEEISDPENFRSLNCMAEFIRQKRDR